MDRMNELARWMKFYDDQKIGGPPQAYSSWDGAGRMANDAGARAMWAENMMGQQDAPQFFSGQPMNQLAAYTQPREFTETMPVRKPMVDPMRNPTHNYLMKLLGGR